MNKPDNTIDMLEVHFGVQLTRRLFKYNAKDIMVLPLGGTNRWPTRSHGCCTSWHASARWRAMRWSSCLPPRNEGERHLRQQVHT